MSTPQAGTAGDCTVDDLGDDATAAQNALNANFDACLTAQTTPVRKSSRCSSSVASDVDRTYIDFCAGGDVTITWTVEDICDTLTTSATYTVNPVPSLGISAPADVTVDACTFDDLGDDATAAQNALNANFDAWLTAQTTAV